MYTKSIQYYLQYIIKILTEFSLEYLEFFCIVVCQALYNYPIEGGEALCPLIFDLSHGNQR